MTSTTWEKQNQQFLVTKVSVESELIEIFGLNLLIFFSSLPFLKNLFSPFTPSHHNPPSSLPSTTITLNSLFTGKNFQKGENTCFLNHNNDVGKRGVILYLISPNLFVKSPRYDPTLDQNPVGKSMKVTDIPKLYAILLANKQTTNE